MLRRGRRRPTAAGLRLRLPPTPPRLRALQLSPRVATEASSEQLGEAVATKVGLGDEAARRRRSQVWPVGTRVARRDEHDGWRIRSGRESSRNRESIAVRELD